MTKKLTQKQKEAEILAHGREHHPDVFIAQPLYGTVERLKKDVAEMKLVKPIPAQVEVLAAMERALAELDALQQKYYPEEEDEEQAA